MPWSMETASAPDTLHASVELPPAAIAGGVAVNDATTGGTSAGLLLEPAPHPTASARTANPMATPDPAFIVTPLAAGTAPPRADRPLPSEQVGGIGGARPDRTDVVPHAPRPWIPGVDGGAARPR